MKIRLRIAFSIFSMMIICQVAMIIVVALVTSIFSRKMASDFFDIGKELVKWRDERYQAFVENQKTSK